MPKLLSDVDLLARLLEFDSTSARSNAPIADFLAEYLDRPGVDVRRLPGTAPDKVNLLAWAGPPCDPATREGLMLSGHLDVVPAGDPAKWSSDPFALTADGDRYVGRGTCDMKGSIALMANVLARLDPDTLTRPLVLLFTCDEEVGTLGARVFVEQWPDDEPLPASAIIGEPTSLRAVRMHKGHIKIRVDVRGKNAHSGSPHLGDNAVVRAAEVVAELQAAAGRLAELPAETAEYFPAVPVVVLNVAAIHGGDAVNVVPDRCGIDVGVRPLPGMDSAAIYELIRRAVADRFDPDRVTIELDNDSPPMLTPADAPIHRTLCDVVGQEESFGVSFSSDGGHLSSMGVQCVLFGPGTIEVAHRPDEHVPIAELTRAGEVLTRLAHDGCVAGSVG